MARGYNSSRYQYETSPRKLQPDYKPVKKKYPKKSTAKKKNNNSKVKKNTSIKTNNKTLSNPKTLLYVGIAFAILFTISYRNALISEEYKEVRKLKEDLALIEKQNEQLKVNIEGATNLGTIEKKAKENLGMEKLKEDQTIYVDSQKQDYIEVSRDEITVEENNSWIDEIINKIKNIF